MFQEIKNETEKMVGKVKEKTGKLIDDDELELKGKVQTMKANMQENVEGFKEKAYDKANDIMDNINKIIKKD